MMISSAITFQAIKIQSIIQTYIMIFYSKTATQARSMIIVLSKKFVEVCVSTSSYSKKHEPLSIFHCTVRTLQILSEEERRSIYVPIIIINLYDYHNYGTTNMRIVALSYLHMEILQGRSRRNA